MSVVEILACVVLGLAGSAVIGLAFGAITRLESRGGFSAGSTEYCLGTSREATSAIRAAGLRELECRGGDRAAAMSRGIAFAPEKDGRTFLSGAFDKRI